ncbi:hypothetical protein RJT34_19814 [Clitoria ternatea]|uniref:Uncharacterized protein n=1 Tax=Clitoria ternatea TaxID=43366 RepID=A0AAN9IS14_CLITE
MSQKKNEVVAGIVLEEVDDEKRIRVYAKKYKTIVRQFDELMRITTAVLPKRHKGRRGNGSGATNYEELIQTVTRFLHELSANSTNLE